MDNVVRPDRIVLILRGKYAGKKAVVISVHDKTKEIPFQHALLAGILKAPRRINKSMPKKKIDKRIRIKPFTKVVNLNHLLPTRYTFKTDLKSVIKMNVCKDPAKKSAVVKNVGEKLHKRYMEGKPSWLFKTLRF